MNVDEIKKLKVARVKCDNSLLFFTRYFFNKLRKQKFIVNWHHTKLCQSFERVGNYEIIFLNINQPPRTSKTELAVNFIAQGLGKNPNGNYLYITASDDLRSEVSVKIRDIITCPEYASMYGIELKKDQNAKNLWRTTQGGGLKTATIQGQITGFGAGQMIEHDKDLEDYIRDFEGCIILDDINKIGDALMQNANNEKANKRIFDTILSRKNSPDTPLINIQQRSGVDDATANLLTYYEGKNNYESIVLPIISPEGVPLWKWKFPLEEIELLRVHPKTCHMFETQYMQNPQPLEGLLFPSSKLKRYKPSEFHNENVIGKIGFIDTADLGDDFYCYGLAYLVQGIESILVYIAKVIFTKDSFKVTEPRTVQLTNDEELEYLYLETNKEGSLYYNNLKKQCPNTKVIGVISKGNKEQRIIMQSDFILDFYFVDESEQTDEYKLFFANLTSFLKEGKNKHDDAADDMSGLSKAIRAKFGHLLK